MTVDNNFAPTREEAINSMTSLSRDMRQAISRTARQNRQIEIVILVLTVLTSGALWVLISQSFEKIAAWSGATISTILLGLMLYQRTQGPNQNLERLVEVQKKIDDLIIMLRSGKRYDPVDYQRRSKEIVNQAIVQKYQNRDPKTLTLQERQELEQSYPQ